MAKNWPLAMVVSAALASTGAWAQSGWVDPPAGTQPPAPRNVEVEPRAPAPAPAPPQATPAPPQRAQTPPAEVPAPSQRAQTPPAETPAPREQVARPAPAPPAPPAAPAPPPAAPAPEVAQTPPPAQEPPRRQARPEPAEAPAPAPREPAVADRPAPRPAPREPAVAERPAREREETELAEAARRLATSYLDFWSASNGEAMASMPDFYAPRVEFHGRVMSARALIEEKRRFVRRWPDRTYSPRADSMRVSCATAGDACTVRTLFDFAATNARTGRRSAGTGQLELVVALAGRTPVIVAEASQVMRRGQLVADDGEDED